MSKITLKFDIIRVNKKEFHNSKEPIDLMPVNIDQIVVFDKFKHSDQGYKYFIGYQEDENVKTCLFLLEMIMCWINTMRSRIWLKNNET